jgi:hypothetical protein
VSTVGGHWGGVLQWESSGGFPGGTVEVIAIVAETGEFRFLVAETYEQWFTPVGEQVFGTLALFGANVRTTGDAIWAVALHADNNPWGVNWGSFGLSATLDSVDTQQRITGPFQAEWTSSEQRVGTLTLHSNRGLYERESSLETLQGTYTTTTESLTIDGQGAIFYQSSGNNCTGNGTAEVIDARYNMYQMHLDLDNCTGIEASRNGLRFAGLAYIGDNNSLAGGFLNRTLVMAISASTAGPFWDIHLAWNLLAHGP